MDKTELTTEVAHLFRVSGYNVDVSVSINNAEIDIRADETQGLIRKTLLVECADHERPVGIVKMRTDINKLDAAREFLKENAVLMHVSRHGYTADASGFAHTKGISCFSLDTLIHQLVNFDAYIHAVEADNVRDTILAEYQPTKMHFDGQSTRRALPAMEFLLEWLAGPSRWLTVLGDYGVGKSWMLKRLLYLTIEQHKAAPSTFPLPFFVPLQSFTKAFDYQNLILRSFQINGLSGVPYAAFEHLARTGRIVFLFDSFDEMAQHLNRETIRENLKELLVGMGGDSKAIMTSRPTYFESRAERLVARESDGTLVWHPLDVHTEARRAALSHFLTQSFEQSQFARLLDLSATQRRALFGTVLGKGTPAYRTLNALLTRFSDLGSISQRAVIARLLTTVAETLSSGQKVETVDGFPLIPDDLKVLNQGKIFEIVTHNLLYRDQQIGTLSAADRFSFLKAFAVTLQQPGRLPFADPEEIRALVASLYQRHLQRSDAQAQLLEQFYRTCRRHSGLTTESQFQDTTGRLDLPVEEDDPNSRVGFSHNSLREYLVAEAFADWVSSSAKFHGLSSVVLTDTVIAFFSDLVVYAESLSKSLSDAFRQCGESMMRERLFKLLFGLIRANPTRNIGLLGKPPDLNDLDLSGLAMGGLPLRAADFSGSILPDTDLKHTDLRDARFDGAIVEATMFDGADLKNADFTKADVNSILVFDEFNLRTSAVLAGLDARQWLYSHGAKVAHMDELNPLLGKPWYEAAREVTRTLERRIAGTHQDSSLAKGTKLQYRELANEFVDFLKSRGVLQKVKASGKGSTIVKVASTHREAIREFSLNGIIGDVLRPFFDRSQEE